MTFLNPLVLIGLVAASIPLLLHLLTIRKLRTIEFSTISFLKELQHTKIRRLKLRQILLLLVRTLIIILIVLAFARPAMRGTILGTIGTHAYSSVVMILDDSFSMTASDERGELFKQAKDAAGQLVDLMKEGDEVYLIKLSDLPKATIDPATHDYNIVRTMINESQISTVRRPIEDALRLSAKFMAQSVNANKEVYIISDFQKTLFPENISVQGKNVFPLFGERVKFFNLKIGKKEVANVSIDSVEVKTKILEKDKRAVIKARIRNYSDAPVQNYVVSLYFDDVRVAQGNVNIESWGSASMEFAAAPKRTGYIKAYAELENDNIEQDNRRYFIMYIPEKIHVAMISNSVEDVKYILLVLPQSPKQGETSLFEVERTTEQNFYRLDLKNIDVLILSNIKTFSNDDIERIKGFVERGGGLILFPGPDIQKESYNSNLLPGLNIPGIEDIARVSPSAAPFSFDKIDLNHPLFETVFEKEQNEKRQNSFSIESPGIYTLLKRIAGKQGREIISANNGSALLSEHEAGLGKILFFSIPPTLSWSDFPLKGIFAPLIYRSVIYSVSLRGNQISYTTGDVPVVNAGKSFIPGSENKFRLVLPDGSEELIAAASRAVSKGMLGSELIFKQNQPAVLQGFYEIKSGRAALSVYPVNVDRYESDCRKISEDDMEKFLAKTGIPGSAVQYLQPTDNLHSRILESRFGFELWKYCIGFALLLALLEMIIARDSRKSNEPVTSEVKVA